MKKELFLWGGIVLSLPAQAIDKSEYSADQHALIEIASYAEKYFASNDPELFRLLEETKNEALLKCEPKSCEKVVLVTTLTRTNMENIKKLREQYLE